MSRWPVSGTSENWLLASSPASKVKKKECPHSTTITHKITKHKSQLQKYTRSSTNNYTQDNLKLTTKHRIQIWVKHKQKVNHPSKRVLCTFSCMYYVTVRLQWLCTQFNIAHFTNTILEQVMSQLTLSDCSSCVHHCNTAQWTETIPDQVMSQLTLSDCSLWLCSLQFSAGRRHVTTVHTVAHCIRLTSQFSQLSTTAPHHLSRCSTAEQPPPYHILSWRRHF